MIYPEKFPEYRQNFAEQQVYQALEKLGEEFDVFYNKSFARRHPREAALYEIDFIVFDLRGARLNHIFVIEVKGGNMYYSTKRNQWKTGDIYLDTSPEQQAMGYVGNLLHRYHPQLAHKVPLTWLLWFPDGVKNKREHFPTHLSFWRVLDQYALNNPLKNLDNAIASQTQDFLQFQGAELKVYEGIIKMELTQTFVIQPNAKALLQEMKISFDVLEQQQQLFFTGLLGITRLGIEGGAGSGKTMLAKFAALQLAEQGKKVLLLCFNQHLKSELGEGLPDSILVNTLHSFMVDQIGLVDADWFTKENKQEHALYEERIPAKFWSLVQDSSLNNQKCFDVMILDEGQDMHESWISMLLHYIKKDGQTLVFFDRNQNIFARQFSLPSSENWVNIQLAYNYRNSRKINSFINETLGLSIQSGNVPEGIPVKFRSYREDGLIEELERLILQLVRYQKLHTSQLLVLVDGSTQDWNLDGVELPTLSYPLAWLSAGAEKEDGKVYMTSINRFKGCEAEVVILILKSSLLPITEKQIRYTQLSRARGMLCILEKGKDQTFQE